MTEKVVIHWFRRDLRLEDNVSLSNALDSGSVVLPIFIFDDNIISELAENDARLNLIYDQLSKLNNDLVGQSSGVKIYKGNPINVWKKILEEFNVYAVFTNKDYEPYALKRDLEVKGVLEAQNITFKSFKDQVIFEESEVVKDDGKPYTVYTPFKNKWLSRFVKGEDDREYKSVGQFFKFQNSFPSKQSLGIKASGIQLKELNLTCVENYDKFRDFPAMNATSNLGPYLRFGMISIRELVRRYYNVNQIFISELIWREFFMQILYHFPHVVNASFKAKYDLVPWRNNQKEFEAWCNGKTGYPMVDAGMRELNETGYMHNRVRMVVASFLCKHLLIDWRWGEAYFAQKLMDYELASNNGNWQWAAGTGCDAAPYFRVFNPSEQIKKFDKDLNYIKKWVSDLNELTYPKPIVEHSMARNRAIETYKKALG